MKLALILAFGLKLIAPPTDTVTLQMCVDSAKDQHPSTQQLALNDRIAEKEEGRIQTRFKPQINLKGKASYQSDVVKLPGESPALSLPELPQDQYRAYAEVQQLVYDGGANQTQKEVAQLEADLNKQKVRQTHHQLESQVIQLYFSNLLAKKNKATLDSTLDYLRARHQTLQSALAKGTVTEEDLLLIETQIAELKKQLWALTSKGISTNRQLSNLTKLDLDTNTVFKVPAPIREVANEREIQRPALKQLSLQQKQFQQKGELAAAKKRPKISLFAQGGAGYPNPYNFFDNELSSFYMAGINITWPLLEWGKTQKQQEILDLRRQIVDQQKASFRQEVETQLINQEQEITNLKTQIRKDRHVLKKRRKIKQIAARKLDHGTIRTTDYLERVNDLAKARLTLDKHQVELAMASMKYRNILGD